MPPEQYMYEMFLDDQGQKISKSKGNGISLDDWLKYGSPESLALFMFQKPRTAKKLYFDVIPKAVDEYIAFLEAYHSNETGEEQRLENPVWHIHAGKVPDERYPVSFALLLNLVSASNAPTTATCCGAISAPMRRAPRPQANPGLDRLVGFALHLLRRLCEAHEVFRAARR